MEEITESKVLELEEIAVKARELLISTLLEAGSGHSAGPLGMADIFTAFYFYILNHDPKNHTPAKCLFTTVTALPAVMGYT